MWPNSAAHFANPMVGLSPSPQVTMESLNQWSLEQSNIYMNMPIDQVDWALLAKQWITMQQNVHALPHHHTPHHHQMQAIGHLIAPHHLPPSMQMPHLPPPQPNLPHHFQHALPPPMSFAAPLPADPMMRMHPPQLPNLPPFSNPFLNDQPIANAYRSAIGNELLQRPSGLASPFPAVHTPPPPISQSPASKQSFQATPLYSPQATVTSPALPKEVPVNADSPNELNRPTATADTRKPETPIQSHKRAEYQRNFTKLNQNSHANRDANQSHPNKRSDSIKFGKQDQFAKQMKSNGEKSKADRSREKSNGLSKSNDAKIDLKESESIEAAALDANKRKQLPLWIREGLERMEREKQKQMEKDQQEAQRIKEDELRRQLENEEDDEEESAEASNDVKVNHPNHESNSIVVEKSDKRRLSLVDKVRYFKEAEEPEVKAPKVMHQTMTSSKTFADRFIVRNQSNLFATEEERENEIVINPFYSFLIKHKSIDLIYY
jgi:hypothetical protein